MNFENLLDTNTNLTVVGRKGGEIDFHQLLVLPPVQQY